MDGDVVQLSVAVASGKVNTVPEVPAASATWSAGQVTTGAWVSKLDRGIAHISRPCTRSEAMKKRELPAGISVVGLELWRPRAWTLTSTAPPAGPSDRKTSPPPGPLEPAN